MDYDFFLRVYRKYGRGMIKIIHQTLSVMRDTGISSRTDWKSLKKRFKEERKAHKNNCRYWFLFYPLYWSIYLSYRFIKSKLGI